MNDSDVTDPKSRCCGPSSSCCGGGDAEADNSGGAPSGASAFPGVSRREFLTRTGAASIAVLFAGMPRWAAGTGEVRTSNHLIPKHKNLPADWADRLWDTEPTMWTGNELNTIGMPVGGIGAGQLYVCGDGTLGLWEIFNEHQVPPHGLPSYVRRTIPKPVDHGMAVYCESEGEITVSRLDQTGFNNVSFRNTHPIATINYAGSPACAAATVEAFSPFIPLNAKDSALPATLMLVTVENRMDSDIKVGVASWIQNVIGRKASQSGFGDTRTNKVVSQDGTGRIVLTAEGRPVPVAASEQEPIVFADFEGADYGEWKVEGDAFGEGPATGNLPTQSGVEGYEGKGYAGSFRQRDATTGRLISPEFTISRRYINFIIGGGKHPGREGILLVIDGKVIRTATGKDSESMTWQSWDVSRELGKTAHLEIIDELTTGWGHTQVDHIEFSDSRRATGGPDRYELFSDAGTMTWAVTEPLLAPAEADAVFVALDLPDTEIFTATSDTYGIEEEKTTGIATRSVTIPPGKSHTFMHVLTWHFPNTTMPGPEAGHYYASLFADAEAVLDYVMEHRDRLIADTRLWRDTYYDSTLPPWLLERVHLTSSCLATGTTMWWKNGRFWAWEGVTCCAGTCTHVYNYVQTVARLFPELERNIREQQDLKPGVGLEPSGLVGFRHDGKYAADGQCGTVLKVYREHKMSADSEFLKRNWAATKLVLNYAIKQDGNADGILEGSQHNTYDVDFHGPNTFVGALYLAALRAGEEMAREMGEPDYADKLHRIYEAGREFSERSLWNGEWFYQIVDLKEHPQHQYGPGCLSDQVFGQNWARQLGLGDLYDPEKVRRALQSIWEYNWAPDLGPYNDKFPAQRVFAEQAEAGLFNCTWPSSEHLDNGVLYRDEVWTGVEYQVASHMVYEGMIDEAMTICRAVHDRYTPARRNPFNEIECSDFYSRAMASWGMLLALSGVQYHGPKGELFFAPLIQASDFRSVFNGAEGWGTFAQKIESAGNAHWELKLASGQLRLNKLTVAVPGPTDNTPAPSTALSIEVTLDGQPIADSRTASSNNQILLELPAGTLLKAGQSLIIKATA